MTNVSEGVQTVVRHHFAERSWRVEVSEVVTETPVTVMVNGAETVTAAVTPIDLEDWALGYLAGEGVITHPDEVTVLLWRPGDGQIWMRVPGYRPAVPATSRYLGSCCGQSRPGFFNPRDVPPLTANLEVTVEDLQRSFTALNLWSSGQHSGGLHVAGLGREGTLLVARADIGRHNALDKVYGATLGSPEVRAGAYLVFSGRLSAEIVWKVRAMGVEAVVSNAAPTSLGIELAKKLGITAVAFLRGDELSVYSHPERLTPRPLP